MDNGINVRAKIIDKKNINSKIIILVYDIENISKNRYQDLYFNFNVKQNGIIKKILLEKNRKYMSYTSGSIYVSNIYGRENMSFGIVVSLNDDNEKIWPIELIITFSDYLGKTYEKRVMKYLKNEDEYKESQDEILFLYTSKEYMKYKDIINYKILLINNIYEEIKNIVIPINIPNNTKYIRNSLIIAGIKKKEQITSIKVESLKWNECICVEYSVEIDNMIINESIINTIKVLFKNNEDKYANREKTSIIKVKEKIGKNIDVFKEKNYSKYRIWKKL